MRSWDYRHEDVAIVKTNLFYVEYWMRPSEGKNSEILGKQCFLYQIRCRVKILISEEIQHSREISYSVWKYLKRGNNQVVHMMKLKDTRKALFSHVTPDYIMRD
ncbi:uncharacterized protein [Euwallacea fornicatus]|uniref:uncharacterized protein n=1 Tax=Euwallacea fornicatus TaxID=995702 RepID=UPI00338F7186